MAWTDDDHQTHKQLVVGGKTSSCVGKDEVEDPKIHGSTYIENALNVGEPDRFEKMEGTVMINKSDELNGHFALQVKDDQRLRNNLWVEEEVKCKQLVVKNINAKDIVTETVSKESCNFLIDHQGQPGKKLRYTSLEGPEAGVYFRGRLKDSHTITLPEEWEWLVDEESITVQLQPIGDRHFHINVVEFDNKKIHIMEADDKPIDCFYHVYGERKDIPRKPVVEDS